MSALNTFEHDQRKGCGWLVCGPADCDRPRPIGVLFRQVLALVFGAYLLSGLTLVAQTSDFQTTESPNNSWTATTDSKNNNVTPTRIIESHSQEGNRSLDKRSSQIRQSDGRYVPYRDSERETLQVDATTVRTTTRTFARDGNGEKTLVQVTEEEQHTLPGGGSDILRITSTPNFNGGLRPVLREIVETKVIDKDVEETQTTAMLPSVNGGLVPAFKVQELRKRDPNNTVECQRSTLLSDGAANWQVKEIRQATTLEEGKNRSTVERVFRPDSEGKLSEVSHVVSKGSESASGEKQSVVETYSTDVPGTTRDGSLHLVDRKTSTERSSSTGQRTTEQTIEQTNPGAPTSGLRVSVLVDGRMVPGPMGEQSSITIRARDSSGNFGIVSVDTTKSDRIPTIQIQQTPSGQSK